MRRIATLIFVIACVVAVGPGAATAHKAADGSAKATIRDAAGAFLGTATIFTNSTGTAGVSVRVSGITPGFHGFHIHAVGRCEPPFTSAGGHLNPGGGVHGNHAGDLPALLAQAGGRAQAVAHTDRFRVAQLFDADGSAIIVHADPDNLAHIPSRYVSSETGTPGPDGATLQTGDAGARVGCGVITR